MIRKSDSTSQAQPDLDVGESASVWRYARASRAHVVIDAADYFGWMQDAFMAARQRILLVGWDFDTRVRLGRGRRWWNGPSRKTHPARLGALIVWLCNRTKGLDVRVLKWNFGALKFVFRGTMIIDLLRWWWHRSVDFKFDAAHPLGCSHHQKLVVIDDSFAVCGGIDMTTNRWDTPEHLGNDARRRQPNGKLYGPWHDLTMMVEGPAAARLGDLGRQRWQQAGGVPMEPCRDQKNVIWPKRLEAEFTDVEVGIARTRSAWHNIGEVREIEELFVEQILRAKHFIYAESQYFAARVIAEALAQRLSQPNPPEVVLINPKNAEGWLEEVAMDGARVRLCHAIGEKDAGNRFRIYIPFSADGTPIYVHAKLMIVDDEIVRIGSANMNNRSLGLDSECDVFIDSQRPGNGHAKAAITQLRYRLLAEHCGLSVATVAATLLADSSMHRLIDGAPKWGKRLESFVLRPLSETEKTVADNALFDPERAEQLFEPFSSKRGLFRRGGFLRRPT